MTGAPKFIGHNPRVAPKAAEWPQWRGAGIKAPPTSPYPGKETEGAEVAEEPATGIRWIHRLASCCASNNSFLTSPYLSARCHRVTPRQAGSLPETQTRFVFQARSKPVQWNLFPPRNRGGDAVRGGVTWQLRDSPPSSAPPGRSKIRRENSELPPGGSPF